MDSINKPFSNLLLSNNKPSNDTPNANPAPSPRGGLDVLPSEIRWQIYEELLLAPHIIFITEEEEHKHDQGVLSSLLLVNKTIRKELQDLLDVTAVNWQHGLCSDISISYVNIFNPDTTTFRIITTRAGKPLRGDWALISLWHTLLILYQCDANNQLKLFPDTHFPSPTREESTQCLDPQFGRHSPRGLRPSYQRDYYILLNFLEIHQALRAEFNAAFGQDIPFKYWQICEYDSEALDDQLIRIPFAYHREMHARGIKGKELIREVCRLEDDRRWIFKAPAQPSDPPPPPTAEKLPCYHGDDEEECLSWPLMDYEVRRRQFRGRYHTVCPGHAS